VDHDAAGGQCDALAGLFAEFDGSSDNWTASATTEAAPSQKTTHPSAASTYLVGPTTEELESLNELIRFDHVYVKQPVKPSHAPTPTMVSVLKPNITNRPMKIAVVKSEAPEAPVAEKHTVSQSPIPTTLMQDAPPDLHLGELVDLGELSCLPGGDADLNEIINGSLNTTPLTCRTANSPFKQSPKRKLPSPTPHSTKRAKLDIATPDSFNDNTLSLFDFDSLFGDESGLLSDGEALSPKSIASSPGLPEAVEPWEDSFTELFPSLV
jgi:hypothetical protein